MSDSFKGFKRSCYNGGLRASDAGETVFLCGWVQRRRDLGGLVFVTLRDRTGVVQCVFNESKNKELFEKALTVRSEFVLAVRGIVRLRDAAAVNKNMETGEVEVEAEELRILSRSETPPFEIVENSDVNDMLRLKYRYLDLRRPDMQRAIELRHRVAQSARRFYDEKGFFEIETPMLTKSTPEGARDYLVPSRVHPGQFYALPQSPQQYKQLLMLAGFDRYFQIVRCFRDEDLRADRQPEFTQIDIEMSFVDVDDVIEANEGFVRQAFMDALGVDVGGPFLRLTYAEAMRRFGSDKPDMRFGFELIDATDIAKTCGFKVFSEAAAAGGSVRMINLKGCAAKFARRDIDALTERAKTYRAKGLAWLKLADETTSSFAKFLTEDELAAIISRAGAEKGDLVLVVADQNDETAMTALGEVRLECAQRLGILDPKDYKFLWVTEFPLFEYSEEEKRFVAKHHPFTSPMEEDVEKLDTDPGACRAKAYDIVLNGTELGGGSIRIFSQEMQAKMFSLLGFSDEDAKARFGHLLEAFRYGAPPHGGMAFGFDRLVMLMAGASSLRDVMAFPKVQNASEPMTDCPSPVDASQLDELGIALKTLGQNN